MLEYLGDDLLLHRLTAFTATKRHSLFVTDHKEEYDTLKAAGERVVFTNRKVREINDDTTPYPGSESYYHVVGYGADNNGKTKLEFRQKFCFCTECRQDTNTSPSIGYNCMNKDFIGKINTFE